MPTSKKIFTVQNLTQKLKDTKALVLADYRGLSVSQMADLREEVKKAGGELEVVKNRLLGRAAKEAKVAIADEVLTGPTAALWAWEDEIEPIKALHDFSQKAGLPKIKLGLFEGRVVSLERVKELASLPSLNELKLKLVNTLQSPTFGLTNALNWNVKKLVLLLNAKSKKQNEK